MGLLRLLEQLGWTQTEIGERLGVSQDTISRFAQKCHLAQMYNSLGDHWNVSLDGLGSCHHCSTHAHNSGRLIASLYRSLNRISNQRFSDYFTDLADEHGSVDEITLLRFIRAFRVIRGSVFALFPSADSQIRTWRLVTRRSISGN